MYYVIGSGPSGVACAQALLDQLLPVTMIDVGKECETDIMEKVNVLGRQSPDEWDWETVKQVQGSVMPNVVNDDPTVPTKFAFGSSFPYENSKLFGLRQAQTKCVVSYARGGLSNVWGAAMLPYRADDFKEWPITLDEMLPHYKSVAEMLEIAGVSDDLDNLFPFHVLPKLPAPISRQATYILERMSNKRKQLQSKGFTFGRSRLAIRTEYERGGLPCQQCGQCLTGCPYMAIYNSTQTLELLNKNVNFKSLGGLVVKNVREIDKKVLITCQRVGSTEEMVEFEGDRVFLACGVLSTIKVVMTSLGVPAADLTLLYQPYFLLPLWLDKNFPDIVKERLHTLAHLFLELFNPNVSTYLVHMQVYTYNDLMRHQLNQMLSFLPARLIRNRRNNFIGSSCCNTRLFTQ